MARGSLFSAALLLAFLCTCLSFDNTKADLIGDVCATALNPKFCNKFLRSDSHSAGADLRGLGQIAIDNALKSAKRALALTNELGNGELKSTCNKEFGDAIDNLIACQNLIGGNDKFSLNIKASAALDYMSDCDEEAGGSEPQKLKQASQTTQNIISIILAVSKHL